MPPRNGQMDGHLGRMSPEVADRIGFSVDDQVRTSELRKLAKIAGFRYYKMSQPEAGAPNAQTMLSEIFDTASDIGGYAMVGPGLTAVKLMVDSFAVSVHWNTNTWIVAPVLDIANLQILTIDPSGEPPAGQDAPEFVQAEPATDLSLALSGATATGGGVSIEPAQRIIRFGLAVQTNTNGDSGGSRPSLIMQVSPRLRTPYLLWEMSRDVRAIARQVGMSQAQVAEFLQSMSYQRAR